MPGFGFVSIASILYTLEPTSTICVLRGWTVTLGYTMQLVPILLKVAAINKITQQSLKLKKVSFTVKGLKNGVLGITTIVTLYLTIWTIFDPMIKQEYRVLDYDNGLIKVSPSCSSRSNGWIIAEYVWEALLLIIILVLALQSKSLIRELDESHALPLMVYTHFLFLIIRLIVGWFGLSHLIKSNVQSGVTSMLLSGDTLLCVIIYFGDKYLQITSGRNQTVNRSLYNGSFVSKRGSVISGFQPPPNLSQTSSHVLRKPLSSHLSSELQIELEEIELEKIEKSLYNQEREIVKSAKSREANVIYEGEEEEKEEIQKLGSCNL